MDERKRPALGTSPLDADQLRWRCDPSWLEFETTAEVEPIQGVIGQYTAIDALRFGLATNAPGHHIYVRGLAGSGRVTLVRRLMEEIRPLCPEARDRCFVRNFERPDRPRLITLPRGRGPSFADRVDEMSRFIRERLREELESELVQQRRRALEEEAKKKIEAETKPFEQDLQQAGLALVSNSDGPTQQTAVFPVIDGKPVPPDQYEQMLSEGKISQQQHEEIASRMSQFRTRFEQVTARVLAARREHEEHVKQLFRREVRRLLADHVENIAADYGDQERVREFLEGIVTDVAERRLGLVHKGTDFTRLYAVNVVVSHELDESCPVVVETHPTLTNLLGSIEPEFLGQGQIRADHMSVRAGSLLQADGGYLLLDARDVLSEPGAWRVLVRTLRTGKLEIIPPELNVPWMGHGLKPEPIDVNVKVVLIGSHETYYLLDALDPDFPHLFKVLADFDSTIPRTPDAAMRYAKGLARVAREDGLPDFDRAAVVALVEHGARIAERGEKLSARFGRVCDLAREAAFIARQDGRTTVSEPHVASAIARTKARADLPSRNFRDMIAKGKIQVRLDGEMVGEINGLAVIRAGPLVYGFPQRISATVGPGEAGVINIDREADLSGSIHTKGFYILGGLLRRLLHAEHPLAFAASIAFEQSYGGIDGDSASGAEICCLLSSLTGVPLRQDLAMTGAIDQTGQVMAIGAVNEKVEGFFDACHQTGPTPTQGCVIPASNAPDLMLRSDVVEACARGEFRVHAVSTIHQALEIFTGMPAGTGTAADGPDTLLGLARRRAREYWETSRTLHRHVRRSLTTDSEEHS